MNERDRHYMGLAIEEAKQAYNEGEVPVGALLVENSGVIARAHNSKALTTDPTAHAELMVIREAGLKTGDWRLEEATLYVTKEPCVMCAGAMLNARLGRLVYGCSDERFGAVNSRYQLLHDPLLNHQVRVLSGVLEDECASILKEFFRARR